MTTTTIPEDIKRILTEITQVGNVSSATYALTVGARISYMKLLAQDALDLIEVDRIEKESP